MTTPITVDDFKEYFDRDFVFGTGKETVRESDVQRAIDLAATIFNTSLWDSTAEINSAFMVLTAHCLVKAIEAGGGLEKGLGVASTGSAPVSSKSAGSLNVSYALPEEVTSNPILADFLTTGYGRQYLQMLAPRLVGNMASAESDTNP
jgi:hypothetical protein